MGLIWLSRLYFLSVRLHQVKVCLYTYIQIYLYTWSMPKSFIKERFWVLPFVVQRGISKIGGMLWSVYMYIQSVHKDRIRSVLCAFTQEDPVPSYMDHNAHGSVIYTYRICTYRVLMYFCRSRVSDYFSLNPSTNSQMFISIQSVSATATSVSYCEWNSVFQILYTSK